MSKGSQAILLALLALIAFAFVINPAVRAIMSTGSIIAQII